MCISPETTVFSQAMIEGAGKGTEADNTSPTATSSSQTPARGCRVARYAPKYGFAQSQEEMIVVMTQKVEQKKYKGLSCRIEFQSNMGFFSCLTDLKVTFQSQTGDGVWSAEVTELTMKDRILSFKTPLFPNLSDKTTAVDINISLNDQLLEQLKYFYLDTRKRKASMHLYDGHGGLCLSLVSVNECSNCQRNALINTSRVIPNTPNKRSTTVMLDDQDETDGVVPTSEPASALRQSVSQSVSVVLSHTDTSNALNNFRRAQQPLLSRVSVRHRFATWTELICFCLASLPPMHLTEPKDDEYEKLLDKIIVAVVSLFADNDNKPLFRLSRPLLKRKPQTLHQALDNDHLSLMVDFIPLASLEILQARNERGETLLLHAIRLNRINVVQALMDSKHASIIVSDVDNEKNNIFHILASNTNASDLLDLVIQFLETKNTSTPIGERFDQPNESGCTPLQVSVCQNNLLATQRLFKYSKTKICLTRNLIGDSLVHLAVRHADLTMIKYLIEEGDLFQQGNQSNLTMTPIELARSLKRQDMVEYFEQKYPRDESEDDDSSDDDESQSNSEQWAHQWWLTDKEMIDEPDIYVVNCNSLSSSVYFLF